jgi:diguanylate cyclase (GGDEF)-like protein
MTSHAQRAEAVQRCTPFAAGVSVVVGLTVLVGWALDIESIKSVAPGLVSMKANTAIGFVLTGLSLWLLRDPAGQRRGVVVGRVLGGVVAAVAAATLAEYVFGIDLRIDHLFEDADDGTAVAGRPSPHTAIAFLAVGAWLVVLPQPRESHQRVQDVLSVLASVIVLQAAVGYLYGVQYLYGITEVTGMAVHTMLTFMVLSVGILAARPDQGFMGLLTSDGAGGIVVRRLAPAVLLLPLLIGFLRLTAQEQDLIGTRDGIAIVAGVTIVLLGAIVVFTGLLLNRADVERRALEARLQELADRDPLTHLFNRRRFDQAIEHELALAARHGHSAALIMIDVDGLKQTNDTYGHRGGDELILGVASVLNSELRATDTAARLGGDEFAVLLPRVDLAGAETTTAKLLEAMRNSSRSLDGHTLTSTISAGIAVTDGSARTPSELASAADGALYRAKTSGGDSYAVAPQLDAATS